jgi:hypothetical protein
MGKSLSIQVCNIRLSKTHFPSPSRLEIHFCPRGPRNKIAKAASITSLVLGDLFFTPRRALRIHLAGLRSLLRVSGISLEAKEKIPKDPRTIHSHFRLDPVVHQFLSCPKCHCLYPYSPGNHPLPSSDTPELDDLGPDINSEGGPAVDTPEGRRPGIASKCLYQQTPQSQPCNTPLWKLCDIGGGRIRSVPLRKYLQQDLKCWLGCMLSRKGVEDAIEACYPAVPFDSDASISDLWSSKIFSLLRDAKGHSFFPGSADEGRLIFSLSIDGFNPFHNKTAKQTASSTGIWLVLLNLPPHERYLPENIFLAGVIPGPYKPETHQINHYLALVVKDLQEFWDPGVFFSRTYRWREGRMFRAMLVPLVADMPAVRQAIGIASSPRAHYFCTLCDLDIDDIDFMKPKEWPRKDLHHIREFAEMWKNASSERYQDQIFEACGIRWSALLDLPYWDPVLYSVVDSMHALDLGLFQHHCRDLFQINIKVEGGDGFATPRPPVNKRQITGLKPLQDCVEAICSNRSHLLYELLDFHRKVLFTICLDNEIRWADGMAIVGTKWILANQIYTWVR